MPNATLWDKYEVLPNGCWRSACKPQVTGYVRVCRREGGKKVGRMLHRIYYELHKGPIPAGMTLDHLCGDRACVNPDHLEPVTIGENLMRSPLTAARINSEKTHCPRGHPYEGSNLRIDERGQRICRACGRAAQARRYRNGGKEYQLRWERENREKVAARRRELRARKALEASTDA